MGKDTERRKLIEDARIELRDVAEDLFYAAKLLRAAGEPAAAAEIASIAERVLVGLASAGQPS